MASKSMQQSNAKDVARQWELKSLLTRSRFFQAVDELNLLNRIDLVMAETGVYLDYNTELRTLLYLSDAVGDRVNKRKKAQEMAALKAKRK